MQELSCRRSMWDQWLNRSLVQHDTLPWMWTQLSAQRNSRTPMRILTDPMFICLLFLQETSLHAPLPPGLRGPVVGHQQEVSNLSSWHRNTAEPRQLMGFSSISRLVSLLLPLPFYCAGCFCQMSKDFMWHNNPSDSCFTEPNQNRERLQRALFI